MNDEPCVNHWDRKTTKMAAVPPKSPTSPRSNTLSKKDKGGFLSTLKRNKDKGKKEGIFLLNFKFI